MNENKDEETAEIELQIELCSEEDDPSALISTNFKSILSPMDELEPCPSDSGDENTQIIECKECEKTFTELQQYEAHLDQHNKPYNCEVCGKCFSIKKYLTVHKQEHEPPRQLKCQECGLLFTQQFQLDKHKIRIHSKLKCSECGRGFSNKAQFGETFRTTQRDICF